MTVENWGSAYSSANERYDTSTFDISGINAACDGLAYSVTLANGAGASLGETTGTLSLTGDVASFTMGTAVNAEDVERVAVVFYG